MSWPIKMPLTTLSSWGNGGDLCTRQANLEIAEVVPWHLGS